MKRTLSLFLSALMILCLISVQGITAAETELSPSGDGISITHTLSDGGRTVNVSWDPVSGAAFYRVWFTNREKNTSTYSQVGLLQKITAPETSCKFGPEYTCSYGNGGIQYMVSVRAYSSGEKVLAEGHTNPFGTGLTMLGQPTVTFDYDGVAAWTNVTGTDGGYALLKNETTGKTVYDLDFGSGVFRYDFSPWMNTPGTYHVEVCMTDSQKKYRRNLPAASESLYFSGKFSISGLRWSGNTLMWNAYPNAYTYTLILYKAAPSGSGYYEKGTVSGLVSTSYDYSYDFAEYGEGKYLVHVTARDRSGEDISFVTESPERTFTGGFTVSGSIYSFLNSGDSTQVYLQKTGSFPSVNTFTGNSYYYRFDDVKPGRYTLTVKKNNHATYSADFYVDSSDFARSVTLHPLGDIDGDGEVTTFDYAQANAHAKGARTLTGYELACANVAGDDDVVTTLDAAAINAHAKGAKKLW